MPIQQLHDNSMSVEVDRKWHRKPSLVQNLSEGGCKLTERTKMATGGRREGEGRREGKDNSRVKEGGGFGGGGGGGRGDGYTFYNKQKPHIYTPLVEV